LQHGAFPGTAYYSGGHVSIARPCSIVLAVLCAMPLWAGVDEDWKSYYGQALHAAAVKDYPKAEAAYARALHEAEVFGKDDERVASTLQGLATMLRSERKLDEAENAVRRAVTIYSVKPGEQSLEYAQVQFVLAGVLMDRGKYEPALQSIQKVLPLFEQNLGPNAAVMGDATCMQGDAYRLLRMFASAEAPLKRCAQLRNEDGGVGTAEFGEAANSLALVYQHLGKYAEADRYFTYAAKIREQSLGIQSVALAETLEAHAILLHQLGRDADAQKKERMAAAIRRTSKK
jgi:tetratricopeptide (TPR) repeat protein